MGGRSTTTTVEEKQSPEGEEGECSPWGMRCSSVLSAGWRLGKAVAIAGAAVASAPVVMPPLLVSAALGLAFSVPAGLLFVGYLCNEEVMSRLLSCPSPAQEDQLGLLYRDEEDMVRKMATKRKRYSEDEEAPDQTETGARDIAFVGVMVEGRLDDEGDRFEGYNGTEMGSREGVDDEGEKFEESKKEEHEYESMEDKLADERGGRNYEVDGTFVMRFQDADASLQLQVAVDEARILARAEEVVTVEEQSVVEREVVVDEHRVSLSDKSGNQQHSVNVTAREDAEVSIEHVVYSSITTEVTSLNMTVEPSDDEGIYSEEEIWEQINALRLIIGYNADRQASSMEELKALYIFTGMEPPASFTDHHDLVDANNKLRFLKSVVGIK